MLTIQREQWNNERLLNRQMAAPYSVTVKLADTLSIASPDGSTLQCNIHTR